VDRESTEILVDESSSQGRQEDAGVGAAVGDAGGREFGAFNRMGFSSQGRLVAATAGAGTGAVLGDAVIVGGGEEGAGDLMGLQVIDVPSSIESSSQGRQEDGGAGAAAKAGGGDFGAVNRMGSSSQGRQEDASAGAGTGAALGDAASAGGGEEGASNRMDTSSQGRQAAASVGAGTGTVLGDAANAGGELEGTSLMAAASAPASTPSYGYSSDDDEERASESGDVVGVKNSGLDEEQEDEERGEVKEEAGDEVRDLDGPRRNPRRGCRARTDFDSCSSTFQLYDDEEAVITGKWRTQRRDVRESSPQSSSGSEFLPSSDEKEPPKKANKKVGKPAGALRGNAGAFASPPAPELAAQRAASPAASSIGTSCRCLLAVVR
jgi:hypothetical protein